MVGFPETTTKPDRQPDHEGAALDVTPAVSDREEDAIDRLAGADGWCPPIEIPSAVAGEISRIEGEALRLGWRRERLWNFRFWPHTTDQPRGLASVMDVGDSIVELNADVITIEKSGKGMPLSFCRFDA